ncbi:MAG: thioesterase family protein [Brachybacterium sp.]|nr:thioesterase family protein [Brachybacterium sp.]
MTDHPHLDIRVPVRWADLDAYGHVNNAAVASLLEEARIEAFWPVPEDHLAGGAQPPTIALPLDDGLQTFIASQTLEYRRAISHRRDGVVVRLWISRIGGASLTVDYQLLTTDDPAGEHPYVLARTVVVLVDRDGRPARMTGPVRERLESIQGPPLVFRS